MLQPQEGVRRETRGEILVVMHHKKTPRAEPTDKLHECMNVCNRRARIGINDNLRLRWRGTHHKQHRTMRTAWREKEYVQKERVQ